MGCSASNHIYAVAITSTEECKHSTPVFRNPHSLNGLKSTTKEGFSTIKEIVLNGQKKYGTLDFLGTRESLADGNLGSYKFISYGAAVDQASHFGSGLIHLNCVPEIHEYKDFKCKFIAIYSKNSVYWGLADMASVLYGFTPVTIYDTLGEAATTYIFESTSVSTLVLSPQHLKGMIDNIKAGKTHKLKNLVIMNEELTHEQQDLAKSANINIYSFKDVIEIGKKSPAKYSEDVKPDSIYTICYTSGTTGLPKGAMISHKNLISVIYGLTQLVPLDSNDYHISYLPLPHIFERAIWVACLYGGVKVGYFNGNPLKLLEDIQQLRPTFIPGVPRVFNKFYAEIKNKFSQLEGMKKCIAFRGIKVKTESIQKKGELKDFLYDKLVFKKVQEGFGGRVRFMLTGAAPISREVLEFMKVVMGCPFYEGYGQTENTGGNFVTSPRDYESFGVGGPLEQVEFKLIDIPEMNYFSHDVDEKGKSKPRGEVLTRGPQIFPGYYKQDAETKEMIDEEGWLHSGDVGCLNPVTGKLYIIDRRKQLFKLAQGEYISPEKLQSAYMKADGLSEIFVHGDSIQSFLVGIGVPNPVRIKAIAKSLGIECEEIKELCEKKEIINHIMEQMNQIAKTEKFNSLEGVKKLKLVAINSFLELGLLTTTLKIKRKDTYEHFKHLIEEMYQTGIDKQNRRDNTKKRR